MSSRFGMITIVGAMAVVSAAMPGCKSPDKGASGATLPGVKVNPANVQAIAMSPTPPANATQTTSIGEGATTMWTADSPTDTDTSWVAEIDIDGDGVVEETSLLWDDENKILFAYASTDVPCAQGGMAMASLLIGVNGKDNPRGRAPGSGFYAVFLDASECGAALAGLYGARFDASGVIIAEGAVVIDQTADDVTIVAVGMRQAGN
ncbi:MAG: hypothetical protein KF745_07885 [Phycisphaeraceae bacterium]|nr:hypothetical protein [Phycisphaeraceae bacterium]